MRETKSKRVLIIDDNVDGSELLQLLLERAGYQAFALSDGASAFEHVRLFRPHVILLDIDLDGISGYDIQRELRTRGDLRGVLSIAMTGFGSNEAIARSHAAGFDAHFVKPVDLETLFRRIDAHAIKRRTIRRPVRETENATPLG